MLGLILHIIIKKDFLSRPLYKIAWRLGTKNSNVLAAYGLSLLKENKPLAAKEVFNKIIKLKPNFNIIKSVRANISMCYWKLGDIDKAIDEYEKIIEDYKEEDYYIEDYSLDKVEEFVNNNLLLTKEDYSTLGYYYIVKGEYKKAEFFSNASLKLKENNSAAFDNLGQIYYKLNDFGKAKKYFNKSLSINPSLVDSNYYLGLIYKEEGKVDKALEYFNKAAKCKITGLNTVTYSDIEKELN